MNKRVSVTIGIILLIIIIVVGVVIGMVKKGTRASENNATTKEVSNVARENLEFFSHKTASQLGVGTFTGFTKISTDGRFVVFGTFDEQSSLENKNGILIFDTKTGATKDFIGNVVGIGKSIVGIGNSGKLELVNMTRMETIKNILLLPQEYPLAVYISPNEESVAINTGGRVIISSLKNAEPKDLLLTEAEPNVFGWYSDSKRLLLLQKTGITRLVEGIDVSTRSPYIYDRTNGNLSPIEVPKNLPNPRYFEWIVQDSVVRWNSGFDDGSHDTVVNLKTGEAVSLGETSAQLANGMFAEEGKIIFVGPKPGDPQKFSPENNGIWVYDEKGVLVDSHPLPNAPDDETHFTYSNPRLLKGNRFLVMKTMWPQSDKTTEILLVDGNTGYTQELATSDKPLYGFAALDGFLIVPLADHVAVIPVPKAQ
jgi:hypothetical protein